MDVKPFWELPRSRAPEMRYPTLGSLGHLSLVMLFLTLVGGLNILAVLNSGIRVLLERFSSGPSHSGSSYVSCTHLRLDSQVWRLAPSKSGH